MKEIYLNQEHELKREVGHFADPNDRGKDEEERYLASRLSQGELNRNQETRNRETAYRDRTRKWSFLSYPPLL